MHSILSLNSVHESTRTSLPIPMPTTMAARRELRPPINRFETDGSLLSSATEDNETPGLQSQQFKLTSFARQEDPVVRWFFRPGTLALVGAVAGCLALLAHNLPKLQLPERVQAHLGLWCARELLCSPFNALEMHRNACAVLMIFCMSVGELEMNVGRSVSAMQAAM